MKKIFLLLIIISLNSFSVAQIRFSDYDDSTKTSCSHSSLDLGAHNSGISFGNSQRWNGLRINFSDCDIEEINGINITLWKPGSNPNSTVNGFSLGLAPQASRLRGISLGVAAVVATKDLSGVNVGGLAIVSNGSAKGINFGGLAVVANGDLNGINIGGLAVVSNRDMFGINFGGLATVANGELRGINFGGLAVIANKDMSGINFGGLAAVANGSMSGINIGGAAVVSTEDITGLSIAIGAIVSKGLINGVNIAGYKTEAYEFAGVNLACGWSEIENFTGLSISGYNRIKGVQTGLVIGLFNSSDELHGVQLGLINIAKNNRGIAKVLPFVNFHFD